MRNAWFEMLDPDGFKHSGDGKICLYKGGFLGDPGKSIEKLAEDPIGSVGGLFEDTVKDVSQEIGNFGGSVSHELAGLDDAVNENLPGGWLLPVAIVAVTYGVPPEVWTEMTTSLGATEAGAAVGASEAGTAVGAVEAGAAAGATEAGAALGMAPATTAGASNAFWQTTLQGLVDMGVPWEVASALPAAASTAGTSSLISGVQAALTGQDVFESALTGGVFSLAGGTIANSLINAGVNATVANIASQATVQALRNGEINPESLLLSVGTNMMNKEAAELLKGAGVPTELIPTALGAVNQALFTGEIDPNKLAVQAAGQFAKGSWDSIKDDLKTIQFPDIVDTLTKNADEKQPDLTDLVKEPATTETLTPDQQWAKDNGVLNADGTIDWASYDAKSGVGIGSSGPEQTEEEVKQQMGDENFKLAYPNGYPPPPESEAKKEPSSGGIKVPSIPVKPPTVPVKPVAPVAPVTPTAQPLDTNALLASMASSGQQQQPQTVAQSDPYAHIKLMEDLFGSDIMQASSGGSIDDLLRILRS